MSDAELTWMTTPFVTMRKWTLRYLGLLLLIAGCLIGAQAAVIDDNWFSSLFAGGLIVIGAAATCCPEWFGRWL